ncbi:MAG TPA: hypothetical protein VFQ47_08155 [Nitrososphaera sp.]|jgi:hypothetical protein|nr:hypothetical protein [Nitrososphaera sp.]
MKKSTKILLAIATIWPFLYMIFFFVVIFSSFFFMPRNGSSEGGAFPALFMIIFPLHFLTMLLIMGLTVFYMVNVFRNDRVEKDKKVLWAVVLFMGNMIAMPIYWYLYIWREEKEMPNISHDRKVLDNAEASSWVNDATSKECEKEYVPPTQPPNWRE